MSSSLQDYINLAKSKSSGLLNVGRLSSQSGLLAVRQWLIDRYDHNVSNATTLTDALDSLSDTAIGSADSTLRQLEDSSFINSDGVSIQFEMPDISQIELLDDTTINIWFDNAFTTYNMVRSATTGNWNFASEVLTDEFISKKDSLVDTILQTCDESNEMFNMYLAIIQGFLNKSKDIGSILSAAMNSRYDSVKDLALTLSSCPGSIQPYKALLYFKDLMSKYSISLKRAVDNDPQGDPGSFDLAEYKDNKTCDFIQGAWSILSTGMSLLGSVLMMCGNAAFAAVGAVVVAASYIFSYIDRQITQNETVSFGSGINDLYANGIPILYDYGLPSMADFAHQDKTYEYDLGSYRTTSNSTYNPDSFSYPASAIMYLNVNPRFVKDSDKANLFANWFSYRYDHTGNVTSNARFRDHNVSMGDLITNANFFDNANHLTVGVYNSRPDLNVIDVQAFDDYQCAQFLYRANDLISDELSAASIDKIYRQLVIYSIINWCYDMACKAYSIAYVKESDEWSQCYFTPQQLSNKIYQMLLDYQDLIPFDGITLVDFYEIINAFCTRVLPTNGNVILVEDRFGTKIDNVEYCNVGPQASDIPSWVSINKVLRAGWHVNPSVSYRGGWNTNIANTTGVDKMIRMFIGAFLSLDGNESVVGTYAQLSSHMPILMNDLIIYDDVDEDYVICEGLLPFVASNDGAQYETDAWMYPPRFTPGTALGIILGVAAVATVVAIAAVSIRLSWRNHVKKKMTKRENEAIAASERLKQANPNNKEEYASAMQDYLKAQRRFQRYADKIGYSSNNVASFYTGATKESTGSVDDILANVNDNYSLLASPAADFIAEKTGIDVSHFTEKTSEDVNDHTTDSVDYVIKLIAGSI